MAATCGIIGLRGAGVATLRGCGSRVADAKSFVSACVSVVDVNAPRALKSCRAGAADEPVSGVAADLLKTARSSTEDLEGDEDVAWVIVFDLQTLRIEVWLSGQDGEANGDLGRGLSFDATDMPDDYYYILMEPTELKEELQNSWLYEARSAADLLNGWTGALMYDVKILDEQRSGLLKAGPPKPVEVWARATEEQACGACARAWPPHHYSAAYDAWRLKKEERLEIQAVRGRRMLAWIEVAESDLPTPQKKKCLEKACFSPETKGVLMSEL